MIIARESASRVAAHRSEVAVATIEFGFATLLFAAFVALATVVPSLGISIFNSPDETANYLFTKTFAETGRLSYVKDYLYLDEENLLHPRGVLTHEGRAVPFNYFGLPVIYGFAQRLVGDHLQYVSILLAAVSAWALYRAAALMFGARAWETWVVALGFTPLIYYLNRPYLNVTLAITFVVVGVWLFMRYFRYSLRRDLWLASSALALAMFCRYEYVLFITPMALLGLQLKHGGLWMRAVAVDGAILLGSIAALFILPVAVLDELTYGSWRVYGYSLFNDVYFPERSTAAGLSTIENIGRILRGVLLPTYSLDFVALARNVPRLTIWLMPVFTLVGLLGGLFLVQRKLVSPARLLPIAAVILYVMLYRGGNDTWNAASSIPSFNVSIVRYWLPCYLVLFFLATFAMHTLTEASLKIVLVVGLLLTGPASVYSLGEESLSQLSTIIQRSEVWAETTLVPNTEPNAIVYSGMYDKRIVRYREAAAWWGADAFYDARSVAASMGRVATTGRPIYIVKEDWVNLQELNLALAPYNLRLAAVEKTILYKVVPVNRQ